MFGFTLYQLFWYFFIYAFLGWCVEVIFCTITTGEWVNRGFLNGPICPIYGVGMCIVLLVLTPLRHSLLALFIGSFLLTSALELVTGFVLKKVFHTSWWDYSNEPFNLGGYICLGFSLAWGLGGTLVMRLLHPPVGRLVAAVPHTLGLVLGAVIFVLFVVDCIATLRILLGFRKSLRELSAIAASLRKGSDALSHNLSDATRAGGILLAEQKTEWQAKLPALEARYDILRAELTDTRLFSTARLMRAFPNLHSLRHGDTLAELKTDIQKKLRR